MPQLKLGHYVYPLPLGKFLGVGVVLKTSPASRVLVFQHFSSPTFFSFSE
jgi:hypothetical protein